MMSSNALTPLLATKGHPAQDPLPSPDDYMVTIYLPVWLYMTGHNDQYDWWLYTYQNYKHSIEKLM